MSTSGRYHEYIGRYSVHRGETMSTSGGYHECIGGISRVHRVDIMMHVGTSGFSICHCTEHPPMY